MVAATSDGIYKTSNSGKSWTKVLDGHFKDIEFKPDDFSKIYRRYKALDRQTVWDYFFKETEDLVEKLCDDFEVTVRDAKG